jgi:hypothetical protein
MDFEAWSKLIYAKQNSKKLNLKFEKTTNSATEFKFIIDSLQCFETDTNLQN